MLVTDGTTPCLIQQDEVFPDPLYYTVEYIKAWIKMWEALDNHKRMKNLPIIYGTR